MSDPLIAFSGMVSWFFFSQIVSQAGASLVESQELIRKVYFPKILCSCKSCDSEFHLFAVICADDHRGGPQHSSMVGSVNNTVSRFSSHYTVPGKFQYLAHTFYPVTLISPKFEWLMHWNPMAATIARFRWTLTGGPLPEKNYLLSLIPTVGLLITGFAYFRKIEDDLSDYV